MTKFIVPVSIIIYFILFIILICNFKEKSKVIKYSFLFFMISLFVSLFFINELVMDFLLSEIIKYIYFPPFSLTILTIVITMIVFLYHVFNDKLDDKIRIINYVFPGFIFVAYIIFMLLNVNINSYNALYDGNSLICIRYISRTFIIWFIVNIVIRYYRHFLRKE